jgi:hypothetical protein
MDTAKGMFAGEEIRRDQIMSVGLEYYHDEATTWDWRVFCRVYGKTPLFEPQPTLRDAMMRLHQITKSTSQEGE